MQSEKDNSSITKLPPELIGYIGKFVTSVTKRESGLLLQNTLSREESQLGCSR